MVHAGAGCDSNVMMTASRDPVKVFLADDSVLIRERVAALLSARAMDIVGQAGSTQDSIDGILAAHPDVVVLDVQLDGGSGLQVLRAVHRVEPEIGFVVFSIHAGAAYRRHYLDAGAQRFLDKAEDIEQLAAAVEKVSH